MFYEIVEQMLYKVAGLGHRTLQYGMAPARGPQRAIGENQAVSSVIFGLKHIPNIVLSHGYKRKSME